MASSAAEHSEVFLVTGAAGFIGRACVEELLGRGHRIAALLHRTEHSLLTDAQQTGSLDILRASITNSQQLHSVLEDYLRSFGGHIRAIVHCAAHASDVGPRRLFRETNYEGVRNLVACMDDLAIDRLVFLSTTDVYGIRDLVAADEEAPVCNNLCNPYPGYKILAEEHIREALPPARRVILRPGAVWGPGDLSILPRVVDFYRRSPVVLHFGKWRGRNRWPAVYVRNVAKAAHLVACHEGAGGNTYNLVDPEPMTIEDYYRMILEICLPDRQYLRSVTVPFALGWVTGVVSSFLSTLLRRRQPLFDPTLYGLYVVSKNLDIRADRIHALFELCGEIPICLETALEEFRMATSDTSTS